MKKWLLIAALMSGSWWWLHQPRAPEILADGYIRQGDYRITVLQPDFNLTARVLSREDYFLGREADISPLDLVLGWGPMADAEIYSQFSIRQSNRWYFWRTDHLPIAQRDVETHSANMHMIPADPLVARQLDALRKHQLIELQGRLVRVDAGDGWHWVSSLTRNDTGNGACELVLVDAVSVITDGS